MRRLFAVFTVLLSLVVIPQKVHASKDKNWIALHIWDAFAPLTLNKTVPEMLISLEVIFQQHTNYQLKRELKLIDKDRTWGNRSTEGHYMVWIHLSDEFLAKHKIKRQDFPEPHIFMFDDRQSDIFTGWGGQANFRDFILDGVGGMANKTILPDGTMSGSIQKFSEAVNTGTADYEAGWYMSDEQALKVLEAIKNYDGREIGYSFLETIEKRPNAPYEPEKALGGNGRNCGDFAFYLLNQGGVLSKDVTESLKVQMWFPKKYWDTTIPLKGSGKKIFKKFDEDRDLYMGRDALAGIAWFEILFTGLNIFDEKKIKKEIEKTEPEFTAVRVWDQENVINWLRNPENRDFRSKRIVQDLLPAVQNGERIETPYSIAPDSGKYRDTKNFHNYTKGSKRRARRKLRWAGLRKAKKMEQYRQLENRLKAQFE